MIALRDPSHVMRLARLGSLHQSRLSFMRILTRRMAREQWRFERRVFDIGPDGVGHAVLTAHGPQRSYSLVAFAHDLPAQKRSDRVIADAWDATFALYDGIPDAADIERLAHNVPLQEAGRVSAAELSLSRANRSVRLWDHVVGALAAGRQPDVDQINAVGYLMRTTAVYGSGKFGAADREMIAHRPEFHAPFQAEMLSVYLTRWFVIELVQHMADAQAKAAGGQAAKLSKDLARSIGIGNSTGLGMAPFLLNHPMLFNNWITAREKAIQAVRSVDHATPVEVTLFMDLLAQAKQTVDTWQSAHPIQIEKLSQLRADVGRIVQYVGTADLTQKNAWDQLFTWAEGALHEEGQEWIASLMIEPYGPLVDAFANEMAADETAGFHIDGTMTVKDLRVILEDVYDWALSTDWAHPDTHARAWYVSEEKLEPRLGERFEEPIAPYEQPLAPGRDAALLHCDLAGFADDAMVADVLARHPEHRHTLRRVHIAQKAPYAEIRDNTISAQLLPIDMLRCKLSFFGATKFDPRSDRWLRICMYGNAPLPNDLSEGNADFWVFPDAERVGE